MECNDYKESGIAFVSGNQIKDYVSEMNQVSSVITLADLFKSII